MGGQGGNPPGSAASDLRREAAGGRPNTVRLQYPEGVHPPPRVEAPWRCLRPLACRAGQVIQLREADLPQVLRASPAQGYQLQEEELRTLVSASAQEEAQIRMLFYLVHCYAQGRGSNWLWMVYLEGRCAGAEPEIK